MTFLDETNQAQLDPTSERRSIAVEANLLRLPLFALNTKGLKNLDGFECRGTTTRAGNTWEFLFRTARSTATLYPGPLSRSVHLAFLSLITEHGLPFANPVTWSWRGLCAKMGVGSSGREIQQLKRAVEATAGLTIYSRDALHSKSTGRQLNSRKAMHLYETVVFVNETLPDGQIADTNYLWLCNWYLDNLNSLFTAPLDHELWRYLDKRSPIASRLYEYLLINFHCGAPQLRFNYPRLAQFLPVRPERYFSDARKQFDPALKLLTEVGITESVTWQKRKLDIALLRFERGDRLRHRNQKAVPLETQANETSSLFTVRELRRTDEQELVGEFYRLWTGRSDEIPRAADLALAKRLLKEYGKIQARALLPFVIEQMKRDWPGAKTFVATERFFSPSAEVYQSQQRRDQQRHERRRLERQTIESSERQQAERQQFEADWQPVWQRLSDAEQSAIRDQLLAVHPFWKHAPNQLQFHCLKELARQNSKPASDSFQAGESDLRTARNPRL